MGIGAGRSSPVNNDRFGRHEFHSHTQVSLLHQPPLGIWEVLELVITISLAVIIVAKYRGYSIWMLASGSPLQRD
jgi:hypothetical protein